MCRVDVQIARADARAEAARVAVVAALDPLNQGKRGATRERQAT